MSLFDAIASEEPQAIAAAVTAARDVNELGPGRTTPLIEAARRGLVDAVKRLLAAGAEPEWRDDEQETALLKAAANGHAQVVAVLAPLASDDEQDLARSFLAAFGTSHAPEYQYDGSALQKRAVEVAARAANFVGHRDPLDRLERHERSLALKKKG
ncbi:MAG: ankyrin repeat domain-containing protein [Myxococcaceae bacterium]|jgi:ankyrin repeat protein|nr:ankyrin repeat domain-containing protein [Myxococcaceae bacterium]MCA3013468.1 ankyrin repeat domain-containing protein [Myxococcaceae bacterium]